MDKCFCHLNGYAVKDATARKDLEILKKITPKSFRMFHTFEMVTADPITIEENGSYRINDESTIKIFKILAEKIADQEYGVTNCYIKIATEGAYHDVNINAPVFNYHVGYKDSDGYQEIIFLIPFVSIGSIALHMAEIKYIHTENNEDLLYIYAPSLKSTLDLTFRPNDNYVTMGFNLTCTGSLPEDEETPDVPDVPDVPEDDAPVSNGYPFQLVGGYPGESYFINWTTACDTLHSYMMHYYSGGNYISVMLDKDGSPYGIEFYVSSMGFDVTDASGTNISMYPGFGGGTFDMNTSGAVNVTSIMIDLNTVNPDDEAFPYIKDMLLSIFTV